MDYVYIMLHNIFFFIADVISRNDKILQRVIQQEVSF